MGETMRPYLRVSDDKRGTSGSTGQQLDELGEDAIEHGWSMGDPYADDGISASEYGVKVRGGFARLIADLEAGSFAASILGIWEASRFSRQVDEWTPALKAMAAAGVRVWVSGDRLYDPANPTDRTRLLRIALDAEDESHRTSRRVLRDVRKGAKEGRPHGWVPWGYRRVYDPITRKLARQEIVESEAEVVRTIYRRLLAGDSLRAIARDFEEQGARSRTGKVLSAQVIRDWATSPTYAGMRRHQPKKNGRRGGDLHPAQWPAIIDMKTWEAVQRLLTDPDRKTRRDGLGKHLLSFIAKCGTCGGPMSTSQRENQGGAHYRCHQRSCVQINEALLDQVVEARVLEELRKPWRVEWSEAQRSNDPELKRVRDELADIDRQLRELGEQLRHRKISPALAAAAEPGLLEDRDHLARRMRELLVPPELLNLEQRRDQIVTNWDGLTTAAKRTVVRTLVRYHLGELRIRKELSGPWCRHESHGRPERTCAHRVAARLKWGLVAPLPVTLDGEPAYPTTLPI